MLAEVNKAWLAGFCDGEGCFTIRKNGETKYQVNIFVVNTNITVLERIVEWYGGSIYTYAFVPEGHKPNHRWECPTSNHLMFLSDILPYLYLKKVQAELCLDFTKNKKSFPREGLFMSEEEIEYREGLHLQVKRLNRKGPANGV